MFQTEFEFTLPKGYVDESGTLHKKGKMRLATAADEILPMKDPRVVQNPGYMSVILMARVITQLGTLPAIDTKVIEKLFTADMAYLQELYQQLNQAEPVQMTVVCPSCGETHKVAINIMGE